MQALLSTLQANIAIVTVVSIAPDANVRSALNYLQLISKQQREHLESVHIDAGDFNKAYLKSVLPIFHQHVRCLIRGIGHWTMYIVTLSRPT